MLCRNCMRVMSSGTEYHPKKDARDKGYRRFYECKKCGDKVFTKESNFQECMSKASEKCRSK